MDLTDAALRERAIILYEQLERMKDGKISVLHAALIALRDAARAEQREADAKILCRRCRAGEAVHVSEEWQYPGSAPGLFHVKKGGAMDGNDLWDRCDAAAIRAQEASRE